MKDHNTNQTTSSARLFLINSISMAPYLSILMTLISIFCFCLPSSSSQTTLKLSLTQHIPPTQQSQTETNKNPRLQTINYLTSSSLARVHRHKNRNHNSSASIPLFSRNYGAYSVSLSFGSPPQNLSFIMDTGSSFVWFPCTHRYTCSNCSSFDASQTKIDVFIPKLSSSAKNLGCNSKKCGWVHRQCNGRQICSYLVEYGSGSTTGKLLSETLHFPEGDVTDFAVGCSTSTTGIEDGVVGFGRGPASFPVQMGVKKFSYCLVSSQFFEERPISGSSELVLVRDSSNSHAGDEGMSYTKFRKFPEKISGLSKFYYLNLRKITVGGKKVKIPYRFLVPGSDGNGGTIIDSGTLFTVMDDPIYDLVAKEFAKHMSNYKRAHEVESITQLSPCFQVGDKVPEFPKLTFHFKGGAKLSVPMAEYFSSEGNEPGISCMTIISSGLNSSSEPSIIIGNYQQQNIYMEYDLENGRLGFKNQICK